MTSVHCASYFFFFNGETKNTLTRMRHSRPKNLSLMRENHVSIRYVGEVDEPIDTVYNKLVHRWWMKCRAGVRFLKFRKKYKDGQVTDECLRCGEPTENVEHFLWECSEIDKEEIVALIPKVLEWSAINILRWMLSSERNKDQRCVFDRYIRKFFNERKGIMDGFSA